jgi:dipeptidyl aminopeptidase/acylaminoacyl peptidase
MNKHRVKENALKFPLVYNIVKANLKDKGIRSKDIKYGDHKRQYYRIFNKEDNSPIIFFVHGGSWWHGSPKRYSYIGKFFNKKGYSVVLISYRLVPYFTYPSQIDDIFKGFKHFLSNKVVKGDRDKIYVIGFSAGGELAANLVFNRYFHKKYNIDKNTFKKFISISGVLDFSKCTQRYAKTIIKNYINNKDFDRKNPINLIKGDEKTPVLCIHGKQDSLINPECSISFIKKINNPKSSRLAILDNMYHNNILNIIRGDERKESKIILDFLN